MSLPNEEPLHYRGNGDVGAAQLPTTIINHNAIDYHTLLSSPTLDPSEFSLVDTFMCLEAMMAITQPTVP